MFKIDSYLNEQRVFEKFEFNSKVAKHFSSQKFEGVNYIYQVCLAESTTGFIY